RSACKMHWNAGPFAGDAECNMCGSQRRKTRIFKTSCRFSELKIVVRDFHFSDFCAVIESERPTKTEDIRNLLQVDAHELFSSELSIDRISAHSEGVGELG